MGPSCSSTMPAFRGPLLRQLAAICPVLPHSWHARWLSGSRGFLQSSLPCSVLPQFGHRGGRPPGAAPGSRRGPPGAAESRGKFFPPGLRPYFRITAPSSASNSLLLLLDDVVEVVGEEGVCASLCAFGYPSTALMLLRSFPRWNRSSLTVALMWFWKSMRSSPGFVCAPHEILADLLR